MRFNFNPFKKNIFVVRRKGKTKKIEVSQVNSHKRFLERQRVYLRDKAKLFKSFGFKRKDVSLALEFSRFATVGKITQRTSLISEQAAIEILNFFKRNKEELIDCVAFQFNKEKNAQANAMSEIEMLMVALKKGIERKIRPEEEYNEGVVERADIILFGKKTASDAIVVNRTLLGVLLDFELWFLKRRGINIRDFEKKDSDLKKTVFGEGREILI
jgi:hypothetical protein